MYKTVKELNDDQLEILKQRLYYMSEEELESTYCQELDDDTYLDIVNSLHWLAIKDETVFKLFDGVCFTDDDFISN